MIPPLPSSAEVEDEDSGQSAEEEQPLKQSRAERRALPTRRHKGMESGDGVSPCLCERGCWAGALGAGVLAALSWGLLSSCRAHYDGPRPGPALRLRRPEVAVLIRGESFRSGGQHSRTVGTPDSIGPQFEAVESQVMYLLAPLREAGFSVRIYLGIGPCGRVYLDGAVRAIYAAEAAGLEEVPTEKENKSTRSVVAVASLYFESAKRRKEDADYFIVLRPDVILKRDIFRLWHAHRSKVAFTFPEVCYADTVKGCIGLEPGKKCHRVPDMIVSVPYLAFLTMWRCKIWQGSPHYLYRDLLNSGVPTENMSFWIYPGYDADPAKDANPLYRLAGRPERRQKLSCRP